MTLIFHRLYGELWRLWLLRISNHGFHGSVTSFHFQTGYVWSWDHLNFDLSNFLRMKTCEKMLPMVPWVRGRLVRFSPTKRCDSFTRIVSVLKCSPRMRWEWTSAELRRYSSFSVEIFQRYDLGSKRIDMMWPHFSVDLMQSLFSASIKDLWFCILRSSLTRPPSQQS